MKRIIHTWRIATFLLAGTISCGVKEQIGRLSSKQADLILEKGMPTNDILRKIAEYGERYGVDYVIDTEPLGVHN